MSCKQTFQKQAEKLGGDYPLISVGADRTTLVADPDSANELMLSSIYSEIYDTESINNEFQNADWSGKMTLFRLAKNLNKQPVYKQLAGKDFYTKRLSSVYAFFKDQPFAGGENNHDMTRFQVQNADKDSFELPNSGITVKCQSTVKSATYQDQIDALVSAGYDPVNYYDKSQIRLFNKYSTWLNKTLGAEAAFNIRENALLFINPGQQPKVVAITKKNVSKSNDGLPFTATMISLFEEA